MCNARFNCTKKGYKGNHRTKFAHTNHKLSREEHDRVANRCFLRPQLQSCGWIVGGGQMFFDGKNLKHSHTPPHTLLQYEAESTQRNWIALNLSSFVISCYHDSPIPFFNIKQPFLNLCVPGWRCFTFAFKTSRWTLVARYSCHIFFNLNYRVISCNIC